METYRPARGGAAFGQLLLRLGFAVLGVVALWLAIDRMTDWSDDFSTTFESDLSLWLQATGLFLATGLLFGIAMLLPVPGRGGRPSVLLGLALPLLLINAAYAVIFQLDFDDLPDFIQNRLLSHPLFSLFAVSFAPLLLGFAIVAAFCPAGYMPLARLGGPPQYAQPPRGPGAPAPKPPAPAPTPGTTDPGRPDNQATRRLPPQAP